MKVADFPHDRPSGQQTIRNTTRERRCERFTRGGNLALEISVLDIAQVARNTMVVSVSELGALQRLLIWTPEIIED